MTVHTEAAANITVITSEKPLVESTQSDKLHTINDVLLRRVRDAPDVEVLAYPKTSYGKDDYVYYTAKDLDNFADEAARKYVRSGLFPQDPSPNEAEVVALLAPSDLNYVVSIFALSRIGFAILFLSTRLSPEAYTNLLRKTNCKKLITCSRYQDVVSQVRSQCRITVFNILEQSAYDVPVPSGPRFPSIRYPNASQRVSFIIHSSGSTGLPKPIFQTHQACIANYSSGIPYRAFLTLPLFHNHGISTTFRAIYAGKRIAIYNANLPLSGSTLVKAMEATEPGSLHCVPYALKLLAETPGGIEALRRCKLVLYGGSSCPDDLGDRLVDAGVYLVGHYGATEMGQLMTSFRDPSDKAWNYMRPLASAKPYLRMVPIGEDLFECVVLDGLPSKVLSNSDDPPGSFHTNDTFVLHPTIPDAWKYIGRLDDRVTLVNGEKVLPIHYENQIREHELVQEAVIFGVGKAIPGLIIIPSEKARDMSRVDIATSLAPTIAIANERTEAFGRITPDMIEILDVGVEYPRTDKGTVIRAAFYKKFASLIDSIYLRFEAPADAKGEKNLQTLDRPQLEEYLLDVFRSRIGLSSLDKSKDFFEAGVDSLQATTARGAIMREIDLGGQTLGQNVVFEYPNVAALARHLYALRTGEESRDVSDELQVMAELISKYSDFKLRRPGPILPDQETVILTGATGSLGAHILSQLVQESHVKRVYCLVRASSTDEAKARVIASLESKGLFPALEDRVVFLATDLSLQTLGLEADVLASLRQSLTTVIHSAWAVNFNLGVASFESQHIRGLYNLINVCLDTDTLQPARFFFCSSISAAAGTPLPAVIPEAHIENLSHAQNMGYARSKLVAENIVKAATEKTGMIARVLRLGQIVGDSTHGIWNQTEAIPLMIRSAVTLKALPALEETPSWMPADKMARAVLELSKLNSSSRCQSCGTIARSRTDESGIVYQVQNRQLFHWTFDLLRALRRAGLEFRIVSQREWVDLLRHSEPDPEKNPTIKLLDFFAEKYDNDGPGRSDLVFETEKTALASEAVDKGYDVIDSGLVEKMVAWMKKQW